MSAAANHAHHSTFKCLAVNGTKRQPPHAYDYLVAFGTCLQGEKQTPLAGCEVQCWRIERRWRALVSPLRQFRE